MSTGTDACPHNPAQPRNNRATVNVMWGGSVPKYGDDRPSSPINEYRNVPSKICARIAERSTLKTRTRTNTQNGGTKPILKFFCSNLTSSLKLYMVTSIDTVQEMFKGIRLMCTALASPLRGMYKKHRPKGAKAEDCGGHDAQAYFINKLKKPSAGRNTTLVVSRKEFVQSNPFVSHGAMLGEACAKRRV